MRRAAFLQGNPARVRSYNRHSPAHRAVNLVIWVAIFALVWKVWLEIFRWPALTFFLVTACCVLGYHLVAAILHGRELRRMRENVAFQEWLDRCAALGRQHGISVPDYDLGGSCRLIWMNRWRGGLGPNDAVQQELDARELRR